jgi:hypothetical protein
MMLPADAAAQPSAEWFEVRGRLFRFFGTHSGWARWHDSATGAWICGQERDREQAVVRATRVAAVVHDPRLIPSRSMPEHHAFADLSALEWNRVLLGVFTYLGGAALLDDVTTIACVLLRLPGAAAMPTGSPVELGEEHLRCEEMEALVEERLDDTSADRIALHELSCTFCARQLTAYRAAAEQVAAPVRRPGATAS